MRYSSRIEERSDGGNIRLFSDNLWAFPDVAKSEAMGPRAVQPASLGFRSDQGKQEVGSIGSCSASLRPSRQCYIINPCRLNCVQLLTTILSTAGVSISTK